MADAVGQFTDGGEARNLGQRLLQGLQTATGVRPGVRSRPEKAYLRLSGRGLSMLRREIFLLIVFVCGREGTKEIAAVRCGRIRYGRGGCGYVFSVDSRVACLRRFCVGMRYRQDRSLWLFACLCNSGTGMPPR